MRLNHSLLETLVARNRWNGFPLVELRKVFIDAQRHIHRVNYQGAGCPRKPSIALP